MKIEKTLREKNYPALTHRFQLIKCEKLRNNIFFNF